MELDVTFELGRFGARLLKVEDDGGSGERKLVAVFDRSQEEARFFRCGIGDDAIPPRTVEVELEQRDELAALHKPIGAVDQRPSRIKVVGEHLLALGDLFGDARLELVERPDVADLVVALHLDKPAGDDPLGNVQVEECQDRFA